MKRRLTILRILTVHCDEITPLLSQSFDGELTLLQRIAVRTHLFCCKGCRRFKRFLVLIRRVAQRLGEGGDPVAMEVSASLSPEARDRIRRSLSSID